MTGCSTCQLKLLCHNRILVARLDLGRKNHFICYIRKNNDDASNNSNNHNGKEYIYKVEGQWSGKFTITAYHSKSSSDEFLDVTQLHPAFLTVEEVGDMDTRRGWQKVTEAIRANDTQRAAYEKSKLENQQRAERKEREERGIPWEPRLFRCVENEPTVARLVEKLTLAEKIKGDQLKDTGDWVYKQ